MMSKSLSQPYNRKNPRTIRGARRAGWHVVHIGQGVWREDQVLATWVGLSIWTECNATGHWIGSYSLGDFAFEKAEDASMFILKWQW